MKQETKRENSMSLIGKLVFSLNAFFILFYPIILTWVTARQLTNDFSFNLFITILFSAGILVYIKVIKLTKQIYGVEYGHTN